MEPLEAEKASIIAEIEESVGIGKERNVGVLFCLVCIYAHVVQYIYLCISFHIVEVWFVL